MQTSPYNVDPLSPHFYKVNLGFTGVYIIFLILALKHTIYICYEHNKKHITIFHLKVIIFTAVKYYSILHGRVIVMLVE